VTFETTTADAGDDTDPALRTAEADVARSTTSRATPTGRWLRRTTDIVLWVATALCAGITVMRAFGLERGWFLSTVVAFTPYVAIASFLLIGLGIIARRCSAAVVSAASAVSLVVLLAPLALGGPDPGPGPTLHVLSSNMKIGAADPSAILSLARQHLTDVLSLDEYTPDAQAALVAAGIRTQFPYSAQTPLPGAFGSAIFSRYPLHYSGYRTVAGGYGQEFATVLVPGAVPLLVVAVHAAAPVGPSAEAAWRTSLTQEPAATPRGPVRLLIGDFNSTLDQRALRTLLNTGYRDVAAQVGQGLDTTWPYDGRPLPPIVLDHALADPRIGVIRFGSRVIPGTDHKAIYATLTLPAG